MTSAIKQHSLSTATSTPTLEALEPRVMFSAVQADSADAFIDTIGVATHWNYLNTSYGNQFSTIKQKLDDLDIRWVRDGLHVNSAVGHANFMELHNDLGLLTTDAIQDRTNGVLDESKIDDKIDDIDDFAHLLIAIEGPNEYDNSSDPDKYATLRSYMDNMYSQVKANPSIGHLPVLGPSMANGHHYGDLGDISDHVDFGNLHPYAGGRQPDNGSLDWWINKGKLASGDKPVWVTEGGYHNALNTTGGHKPVSETVEAKYLPRMYMVNYQKGIERTATYELIDLQPNANADNDQHNFGLLRADGSEKPAFVSLENTIDLLKERDPHEAAIAPFNTGTLDYTLTGDLTDIHSELFQKSDGTFQLVIWQEVSSWNRDTLTEVVNPNRPVTLTFNDTVASAEVYLPLLGSTAQAIHADPTSINLNVPDHLMIIDITPGDTGPATATAVYTFDDPTDRNASSDGDAGSTAADLQFGQRHQSTNGRSYDTPAASGDALRLRTNHVLGNESTTVSHEGWFSIELNAASGETLDLQSLDFLTHVTGGNTVNYALRTSLDNFATRYGDVQTVTDNGVFTPVSFDLSDAQFQGLSAITLHVHLWDTISDSSQFVIIDDLEVSTGSTQSPPQPQGAVAVYTFDDPTDRNASSDGDAGSTAADLQFGQRHQSTNGRSYDTPAASGDALRLRTNHVLGNESTTVSHEGWFSIELNAASGETLDLQSLDFLTHVTGGNTVNYALRTSLDNFATRYGDVQTVTDNDVFAPVSFDLSDAQFQVLSAITLHVHLWDTISDSSQFVIIDDLIVT